MNTSNTQYGEVVSFEEDRGFGFVRIPGEQKDLFFHISAFPHGINPLVGMKVDVELGPGRKGPNDKQVVRARVRDVAEHQVDAVQAFDFYNESGALLAEKLIMRARNDARTLGPNLTKTKLRHYYDGFLTIVRRASHAVRQADTGTSADTQANASTHVAQDAKKSEQLWEAIRLELNLLIARAEYDAHRSVPTVTPRFVELLRYMVETIFGDGTRTPEALHERLRQVEKYFEALVGFAYAVLNKK